MQILMIILMLVAASPAQASTPAPIDRRFSPETAPILPVHEIIRLIGAHELHLSGTGGGTGSLRYSENGASVGTAKGPYSADFSSRQDTGRWWVMGNRLCQQWAAWFAGQTFCVTIERRNDRIVIWRWESGKARRFRLSNL
ncbi:hypothetical protein MCEMSEM23_02824 [Rhabdaerophilaceae bacterium]